MGRIGRLATLYLLCSQPTAAFDFPAGPFQGRLNLSLSYGLVYSTSDNNKDLIATANGGRGTAVNSDDGSLNYDTGIASNILGANAELFLTRNRFTAYVRGSAFYDFEQEDERREHRPFTSKDLEYIGSRAEIREFYLEGIFTPFDIPVILRAGEQTINWGESIFPAHGVDVINPLNSIAASQALRFPNRNPRVPQGMLFGAASLTETVAVEAYYQVEWEPISIAPAGSFLSGSDVIGEGRDKFIQLGGGSYSDLGTDLDGTFELPAGTLGFDENFLQIPQLSDSEPDKSGQYGAALLWVSNTGNASKWGLHYVRYHSRLPLISGFTADQAAIDATSPENVAMRADQLFPIYIEQGLSEEEAQEQAQFTAEQVTLSEYSNMAGYFLEYPEDISMVALTFNTATFRTGTLVAAELSHHMDAPMQLNSNDVVNAVLSPVQFNPNFAEGVLGEYGANTAIDGYVRKDRTQFALSLLQLFGTRLGSTQTLFGVDIAYAHIHDFPGSNEPQLNAREGGDSDSWGYRMLGRLTYNNVLGAVNLSPSIGFSHDVKGDTPAPYAAFREGRKSITLGLRGSYISRLSAELSYTNFFDGGSDNPLIDRDFVRLSISYGF